MHTDTRYTDPTYISLTELFGPPTGERVRMRKPHVKNGRRHGRDWQVRRGPDHPAPKARHVWSDEEHITLLMLAEDQNMPRRRIAEVLGRTESSVATRLSKLRHGEA